jgi:ADP-ribose pyrophosphatase YjhB (NUDIX family)
MENSISFVGCFTVIWNILDGTVHVVLVKRKDKPVWELPGGGLESQDVVHGQNPFQNCAMREASEESSVIMVRNSLIEEAVLVQRIKVSTSLVTGSVHLYSYMHPFLDGSANNSNFLESLESFVGDETEGVSFTAIHHGFFFREDVSLATKRMIAISINRVCSSREPVTVYSALSLPVFVPKFDLTV